MGQLSRLVGQGVTYSLANSPEEEKFVTDTNGVVTEDPYMLREFTDQAAGA